MSAFGQHTLHPLGMDLIYGCSPEALLPLRVHRAPQGPLHAEDRPLQVQKGLLRSFRLKSGPQV